MFAPRRGKRVGLSRKMIRNRFSIMRSQLQRGCGVRRTRTRGENSHARGAQFHARDARWMRRSGKGVRDPPQRCFGDKLEDGREATGGTWERQGRKAGPQGRAGGAGPRRARSKWRRKHHRASGRFGTTGPRRLSTNSSPVFNTSKVRRKEKLVTSTPTDRRLFSGSLENLKKKNFGRTEPLLDVRYALERS